MSADCHVRFSGYRDSPLVGGAYAPIEAIHDLLGEHGVGPVRLVGVPSEYAAGARARGERIEQLGGPWLDDVPVGFRSTRVCRDADGVRRTIEVAAMDGFTWLPIGRTLPAELAAVAIADAPGFGMRTLVEGRPGLDAIDLSRVGSVDGLDGLLDRGQGGPGGGLAELGRRGPESLHRELRSLARAGVPLVPQLAALRRAHLLDEVLGAAGLERLVEVLPYHRRLLELKNPAAYRFGRRHAERYLAMPRLGAADRSAVAVGWTHVGEALAAFVDEGGQLALGTGSPSTGLCPGIAVEEERTWWRSCGLPDAVIEAADRGAGSLGGSWERSTEGSERRAATPGR